MMGINEFEGHGDNIRIGSGEWVGEIKLNMPLTEEDWATIADCEFEHSDEITFRTPKGKEVVFTKKKVGKWIREVIVEEPRKNKRAYARCSSCGCLYNHYLVAVKHFDYCPKCGADMREGDSDA